MNKKIKIEVSSKEKEIDLKKDAEVTFLELPIKIKVAEDSFLHIGAAPSPLTEKKGAVFKVDRTPIIPASSFKGALRHQLEILFIEKANEFAKQLNIPDDKKELLKPCVPTPRPTKAEEELINLGYRKQSRKSDTITEGCWIEVDEKNNIGIPDFGICPICYFMGATGIMGFLRIYNFYPTTEGSVLDQTNIRIDRKTETAAHGAKVDGEQIKPGTVFKGSVNIVISEPMLELQKIQFGDSRKIGDIVIDKWLSYWKESNNQKKEKFIIENILIQAIQNIKVLGGQKSKGAGKITIEVM
jgi:CRISPR/Cas system CSM-associated protein Csm3 (group 7 of RAMP superfamily)